MTAASIHLDPWAQGIPLAHDWSRDQGFRGHFAIDQDDVQPVVHRIGRVWSSRWFGETLPDHKGKHLASWLTRPLTVACDDFSATLPAGFLFDGASVRYRWAGVVIQRWGLHSVDGAKVHDLFYSDFRHLISHLPNPRLWADRLLLWLWRAAGVPWHRATAGYRAVRMFGGTYWNRGTELGFDRPSVTKQVIASAGMDGAWLDHRSAA